MTKAELINEIAISTGFDKKTISLIVESLMDHVKASLAKKENVYLRGFGSFILKTRKAKVARNISKNVSVQVPEHKIVSFKPASELAEEVR
jgi:DNA-binding protein HU-beta